MISKKAEKYVDRLIEEQTERHYMCTVHKCPHCLGDVGMTDLNHGDYKLECNSCGLKRWFIV